MSFRDATKPQDLEPERLKPDQGTPTLNPSVEAERPATPLCTGRAPNDLVRERILAWLAEGVREVTWALCSLPREHWAESPPTANEWTALQRVRDLALREAHQLLPTVRQALGESAAAAPAWSAFELEQAESTAFVESPEDIVRTLGETRFELLQRLEAAPDDAWANNLHWQLLNAHQHELQHVAAIWKLALNWDRLSRTPTPGVPLHPADRLEESH
ncbi:MAG: hypothetical protein JO318_07900 [Chloroflexi bacterium]|nr:hypothetical protein [Chloroflexota bacterium]